MRSMLAILAFLAATASTGWADIVGTWKTGGNESLKISYRDDNHIRMDTGPDSYMLISGSKAYMLTRSRGKWQAHDLDEMAAMMQMFGKGALDPKAIAESEPRLESTGRTETIAGFKGEVYRAMYKDASGRDHWTEVVLSDHPDVKKLNQGWSGLVSRMAQMLGKDTAEALKQATKAAQEQGLGGMLRSGDDMILQSLEKPSLSASHYELPRGVEFVSMPDMGAGAAQRSGTEAAGKGYGKDIASEAGSEVADTAKGTAKEFGDTAKEEARDISDEAKEEAKESVRGGMRRAIEGLW